LRGEKVGDEGGVVGFRLLQVASETQKNLVVGVYDSIMVYI